MLRTVVVGLLLVVAGCDACSNAGEMRCDGNKAQMCVDSSWEDYQDCGAIHEVCGYGAAACSGYSDIACCN